MITPSVRSPGAAGRDARVALYLLDGFRLELDGRPIPVPLGAQRLLALLAVAARTVMRPYVAGTLWPDVPDARAGASLRSALWRVGRLGVDALSVRRDGLGLAPHVTVDLQEAAQCASRWMSGAMTHGDVEAGTAALGGEVLPGWYDDWVIAERERYRQVRLHALETMAERMVEAGRTGDALLAALAAVMADPLRESANRALIGVHLAEGNVAEALRQTRRYERLLADELGVTPSARLAALLGPLATATV